MTKQTQDFLGHPGHFLQARSRPPSPDLGSRADHLWGGPRARGRVSCRLKGFGVKIQDLQKERPSPQPSPTSGWGMGRAARWASRGAATQSFMS